MASWLPMLQLFFCFVSSHALYENISYHDIMMNMAKLQRIAAQQRDLDNPTTIHPPFDDTVLQMISSPWKLLKDGSQTARKLNNANTGSVSDYCQMAIQYTVAALARREGWAGKMVDAMGKLPSGVALGNSMWLGSFSECKDVKTAVRGPFNETTYHIKGQYCLATFRKPGPVNPLSPSLSIGLCVPSFCSYSDVETILNYAVKPINGSKVLNGSKIIAVISNFPPESIPLTTSAIAVITLLSVIGFAILLGTLYDICLHQPALEKAKSSVITVVDPTGSDAVVGDEDRPLNVQDYTPLLKERNEQLESLNHTEQRSVPMRILLAFSIYSNGQKILNTKRTPGTLDCVHGIRFLSMSWVILGHTVAFVIQFVTNPADLLNWLNRWTFQAISGGSISVDSFFVLSGALVSYLLLKQLKSKNGPRHVNWALFYFHRFWRLTPIYMLVLGTHTALFKYWGSGPVWPFYTGIEPNCKDYWWRNLLYINNLFDTAEMCMGWSWYLANDMQFFVISPFVIVAFYYKWFIGAAASMMLIMVTFVSTPVIVVQNDATTLLSDQNDIYFKPWCRVAPYVVGIVTGYLLYITEGTRFRMHKGLVILGWVLAAACNLAVVYGLVHYNSSFLTPMPLGLSAFYQTCSRTAWGLGLAWVIFACCRGYGGCVNTLLSWPGIIPLSRLTYAAYLVHPIVLFYYNFSLNERIFFNEIIFIWMFLGGLVVTYGIAFVTSLAFEAPMMALEKVVFPRN